MSLKSKIIIAGKVLFGSSVREENGAIYVDGHRVDVEKSSRIEIIVQGNLDSLEVLRAATIEVQGSVGTLTSGSGDVRCGAVQGDVQTGSGDVDCDEVLGSVTTGSGDVTCGNVEGNIRTASGDVTTRRA